MSDPSEAARSAFEADLEALGFREQAGSRRGGVRSWTLDFNRLLNFALHDHGASVVLSWSCELGEYITQRGWRLSVTDLSTAELYPSHDVRLAADIGSVEAEITRVLASLRIDLGDPAL